MEKIILPNGEVELITPQNILYINFIGNIKEEDYKAIWEKSLEIGVKFNVKKVLFDQSNLDCVSFKARGWVVLKMLPKSRRKLGTGLKIGIISAKDSVNKSALKYLVNMFEKMSRAEVKFYSDYDTAINKLK